MTCIKNELGWRLYKWRRGFAIGRAHWSWRAKLCPLGPAGLNLLLLLIAWVSGSHRVGKYDTETLLGVLPFSLLLGFWMCRPMVVYTNTKRSVLIPGLCFRWHIPFSQIMFGIEQQEEPRRFCLHALDEKTGWQELIWESTDRSEVARVMHEVFGSEDSPSERSLPRAGTVEPRRVLGTPASEVTVRRSEEMNPAGILFGLK